MARYLLHRFVQGVVVLALVAVVVFVVSRLSGNPVNQMLPENATPEQREALTRSLGLDQPLTTQFARFVGGILTGDFGHSHRFAAPALDLVLSRVGNTVALALAGLALAVVAGLTLGVLSGLRQGSHLDRVITAVVTVGQSVPSFWIGILLILVVGVQLKALPFAGASTPESIVLPALTLSVVPTVSIARVTRSSVVETLQMDHIRTARAKGLRTGELVRRHVLRNAAVPVLTITGLLLTEAVGGAVITERVFAWPGIGSLAVEAIAVRDYAVVQTITLVVAAAVVVVGVLVDLAYMAVDPRIRMTGAAR
ncbi:ABC transporter permease [Kineococcus sp. SYSU DK003]|uniref:ABC transporter permease n=1 Tax=Kineococcus sp. SYSU DK003 TaxID=3383124 RepID=UPI003D7E8582